MRARASLSKARKPVRVSAEQHNEVLEAAQKRVDALEGRLARVVEAVIERAGARAAHRFALKATNHLTAAAGNANVSAAATMICLRPRPDEAEAIADPDGDAPETLHVTLAYLGKTDQPLAEIAEALQPVAASLAPLEGVVGGYGVFDPAGVGILLPDVRGLVELRVAVTEALLEARIDYGRQHGFEAHITVHSDPTSDDQDAALERASQKPLHFDALHVVRGNDEEVVLPLVGVPSLTAAGEPPTWSAPFPDEVIDVDALVKELLSKTEPVRKAMVEQTMTAALKQAGLSWDVTNPLTAKVLAQSASQITSIAETTQLNVMRIIQAAYQNGLTIPQTATAIRAGMKVASSTRATLIARTELAGAANGGSLAATQLVAGATGQGYSKTWRTAAGAKYPRHELYEGLDGQTVELDGVFQVGEDQLQFPGDPDGDPGEVCNCFPSETLVEMPSLRAAMRRWYEGDLVRVRLASGNELAATPNHPVLRADGQWVPLCEVEEGDHLVSALLAWDDAGAPDPDRPPSEIGETYRLAAVAGDTKGVRLRPPDFHGDGADGEVEVVALDGNLLLDRDAASEEEVAEFGLAFASAAGARTSRRDGAPAVFDGSGRFFAWAAACGVSRTNEDATLIHVEASHPESVRLGASSNRKSQVVESADNGRSADSEGLTHRQDAISAVVTLMEVVQVEVEPFHGYVYNLDTGKGWYTAGTIVCRNCRCTLTYGPPLAQSEETGSDPMTVQDVMSSVTGNPASESPSALVPWPDAEVVTTDLEKAARDLAAGKNVFLKQGTNISTFIDDLGKMAADAQKAGKAAPDLDLAKVSIQGTNLFAQDSLGVPRIDMPQLVGIPTPGSPASKLPPTIFEGQVSQWRDVSQSFFQSLRDQGVAVTSEQVAPETLRATQNELNGAKIAHLMDEMEAASPPPNGTVFFEQNMTDDVKALYADQHLDTETLIKAANDAVAENPMRLVHGNTGETAFWISDGKVYSWGDYPKMSAAEREHAVPVHSHSGVNYFTSTLPEPYQSWSDADLYQWFSGLKKGTQGGRQMLLYANGKADIIGIGPTTDPAVLKLGSKTLGKSLEEVGWDVHQAPDVQREAFHRWYEKHGLTYQEVQYAAPNDLVDLAAQDKYLDPEAKKLRFVAPPSETEPVVISSDNYILDGHHRWAAALGRDWQTGVDVPSPIAVERINEPISTLLQQARQYAADMGIPPQSAFATEAATAVTPAATVVPDIPKVAAGIQPVSRSVDIGITPFRAGEDNAVGFYSTAKYQQFERDLQESAQAYGVHVDSVEKVTGVWEGVPEPSVSIHVSDAREVPAVPVSKPPVIDFGDATPEQRERIQQAVDEAYRRMDRAGISQGWSSTLDSLSQAKFNYPHGIARPPVEIKVVHNEVTELLAQHVTTSNVIEINVDSRLFSDAEFAKNATIIEQGGVPEFLTKDLSDAIIHEYGHSALDSLSTDERVAWRSKWNAAKKKAADDVMHNLPQTSLPSKYALDHPEEAWAETFTGLVNNYSQGAPLQEEMRPILKDAGILSSPAEPTDVYRMQHSAPGPDYGAPMYDLTGKETGAEIYPPDIYDKATQLHVYGGGPDLEKANRQSFDAVNRVKGDPNAMVTVYRGVPANVTKINPGDWVTPSKDYAERHASSNLGDQVEGHVISMQVPAGQLWTDGNSIDEWGWVPPNLNQIQAEQRFRAYAANLAQAYNQDGVLLFTPDSARAGLGPKTLDEVKALHPQVELQLSEHDDGVVLSLIRTQAQGQGLASAAMKDILAYADETGKTVALTPSPVGSGGLSKTALEKWYRSLGFVRNTGKNADLRFTESMIREPRISGGESLMATFRSQVPEAQATAAMEKVGLPGARFTNDGRLQVIGSGVDFTKQLVALGKELGEPYDVTRGTFDMMERDAGDYKTALDAFSHPKAVTPVTIPEKIAPADLPPVETGDPITASSGDADQILASAKTWLDGLSPDDREVLKQWGEYGSRDVNNLLSDKPILYAQYTNRGEVMEAASRLQKLVESAPPLPDGTVLYRAVDATGIDPALAKSYQDAESAVIAQYPPPLDVKPGSPAWWARVDQINSKTAASRNEVLAKWAQQRYPVGRAIRLNEPGELASLTADSKFAAGWPASSLMDAEGADVVSPTPSLVFRIENAQTGAPIWPYAREGEQEVIAPSDTTYRVKGVEIRPMEEANGTADHVVVTVEEVPPCSGGLTAAVGLACSDIGIPVPSGTPPTPTLATANPFPGQPRDIARAAEENRDAAIAKYAAAHDMTPEAYRAAAEQVIKDYVSAHPQIRLRMTQEALESMLKDGRYKSEFELPGVTPSMVTGRAETERRMFGYDRYVAPQSRPVYGYLAGTADEGGAVDEYGDIIVSIDPSVNARATFTMGDSYRQGLADHLSPTALSSPGLGSWAGNFDILKAAEDGSLPDVMQYVEVEIHGGLTTADIGGISPDRDLIRSRQDAAQLKDAVEALTSLSANYEGEQVVTPPDLQGLPEKPGTVDVAQELRDIAKRANERTAALDALVRSVSFVEHDADFLGDIPWT